MFAQIQSEIQKILSQNDRSGQDATLVAVSKTRSIDEVMSVYNSGARHFGENYVQEAVEKILSVPEDLKPQFQWHMIGPLQSNKAKIVAQHFDWVQTVDSLKLAKLLSRSRDAEQTHLQVCVQVNIDQSPTKRGVAADMDQVLNFVQQVAALPMLSVRGLMVMPDHATPTESTAFFMDAKALFEVVKGRLPLEIAGKFDTLSMGMSGDFGLAIAAGSTMVRIGTALFGPRAPAPIKDGL